jgi:predicted transport protein
MADIKLFALDGSKAVELEGSAVTIERDLQRLIEAHSEQFLGVRFLATEHATGKTHGGRIDTLGIDENNCPVIVEYKRARDENVINQGLYYLDWLLDHKAEFELLVMKQLGEQDLEINWSAPRLLCIAGDFTKYDVHAVQQINRNIELIRYKRFGADLLLFELTNVVSAHIDSASTSPATTTGSSAVRRQKSVTENVEAAGPELRALWDELETFAASLGDDVQRNETKFYVAFRRLKNFACVEVRPQVKHILAYVKINPDEVELVEGFTKDMRGVGHYGTGDLEIAIRTKADLDAALPLIAASYEAS